MSLLVTRRRASESGQDDEGQQQRSRSRRKLAFWSLFLGGVGAVVVVLGRMLVVALLVSPAVGQAPIAKVATDLRSEQLSTSAQPAPKSGTSPSAVVLRSCGTTACPLGVAGAWTISFDDEFDGTSLDASKWSTMDGQKMNDVTALASNVSVAGGNLILTRSDLEHGAYVSSAPFAGAGRGGYLLPVGSYTEARVRFPGNGKAIYNWPAWWTGSGPAWPDGGEFDIAEGTDTLWTVYHGANNAHYGASIPGVWSNEFHVYGLYRAAGHAEVYWDGRMIASYPTSDNGAGQGLLLNVGGGPIGGVPVPGVASQVEVDYVRAWKPGK